MTAVERKRLSVVTGAAGVLGAAVSRRLVAEGHRVLMMDVAAERLDAEAHAIGDAASPVVADIGDPAAVERACETIRDEHGSVDTLINNAGLLSNHKAEDTSPQEWRRLMAVNLDGAFYLGARPAAGHARTRLRPRGQRLLAGNEDRRSDRGHRLHRLEGRTRRADVLAGARGRGGGRDCQRRGAGLRATPMVTEQLTSAQRRALLRQIPIGRFCEPDEVAELIAFLVSPHAGFITGEIIDINGGLHLD